jgi:hypothetical protein
MQFIIFTGDILVTEVYSCRRNFILVTLTIFVTYSYSCDVNFVFKILSKPHFSWEFQQRFCARSKILCQVEYPTLQNALMQTLNQPKVCMFKNASTFWGKWKTTSIFFKRKIPQIFL